MHGVALGLLHKVFVSDVDNTIADFTSSMLACVNTKFGTTYVREDFTKYPFKRTLTSEQWKWLRDDMKYDESFLLSISPIWDAIAALSLLQRAGYHVIVATDRNEPERTAPITEKWLKDNGVPYDQFVSRGDTTKQQLATAAHVSIDTVTTIADDDPRKCDFVPGPNTSLWLPAQPYTPAKLPAHCTSFTSWAQPLAALGVVAPMLRKQSHSHRTSFIPSGNVHSALKLL